jgi:hypothetical protein
MIHKETPNRFWLFPVIGLALGFLLSARALLGAGYFLASHPSSARPVLLLLALYPIAGALGGVLVALTFPLVRWIGGAFVVGAMVMFPMYLGVGLAVEHNSWRNQLETSDACALFVGGLVGARAWLDERRRPHRLAHVWLFATICSIAAWVVGIHWAGEWPAVIAIFVFLIPVSLAVMVTVADIGERGKGGAGASRAA